MARRPGALLRVGGDDVRLDRGAGGDELGEHVGIARDDRRRVRVDERGDARTIGHERVLGHLAEPGAVLARRQRRQRGDVGEDAERLVERADQVLALGQVDRGLAADGGVDLREQRGRRLHDGDAAVVHRRREAGGVADHAAAEGDDGVVAEQPPRREARAQGVDGGERLGVLAVADEEEVGGDVGALQRGDERRRVEVGDAGLADDRDAPAAAEQAPGLAEHAGADDDVVGRALERDGHPFHARTPRSRRRRPRRRCGPRCRPGRGRRPRTPARAACRAARGWRCGRRRRGAGACRRPSGATPAPRTAP